MLRTKVVHFEVVGVLAPQERQHLGCWIAEQACSKLIQHAGMRTKRLLANSSGKPGKARCARASPTAGKLIATTFGCSCMHVMSKP